ncbi:MAG TPA: ATP-dependent DNA helicase [Rhodospirillaceae bacterium]|nr:MAG: hypothetical protein A2018_02535 [Alphaproteobacteria bacterium GWF2_58_20]HAU29475.1 ATP-dependent DNA helicase [Rhodospirillaceae bacterium]
MHTPEQPHTHHFTALLPHGGGALLRTEQGETLTLSRLEAATKLRNSRPITCHMKSVARKLGTIPPSSGRDILELFAFVHPTRFCAPTPRGIAAAMGLPIPETPEAMLDALTSCAETLLATLAKSGPAILAIAHVMAENGWGWGDAIPFTLSPGRSHSLWIPIPEWEDAGPPPPPSCWPVDPSEARERLHKLIHIHHSATNAPEDRPQQADFSSALCSAFAPPMGEENPHVVLAQAGTGVGKTLGYLAPATLWAEKNMAPVWISTYTKNLQRQVDSELSRLFPDETEKHRRVVIRKGRENYLCLLNYEEAVHAAGHAGNAVFLGLIARWLMETRDGDLGGDMAGWLGDLFGRSRISALADRRGECVFSACPHYRRCFIERSIRKARSATIVIANHALAMNQAGMADGENAANLPARYVFDEGHHIFAAADTAFDLNLSALEMLELRRWLIGAENAAASRARGLRRRIEDLLLGDEKLADALIDLIAGASALPSESWHAHLEAGQPRGAAETFLMALRQQVLARNSETEGRIFDLETPPHPASADLLTSAGYLHAALSGLSRPMLLLAGGLEKKLDDDAADLDSDARRRIDGAASGLKRRASIILAFMDMLDTLKEGPSEGFVDWIAILRDGGHETDCGLFRRHLDPSRPFAEIVLKKAQGAVITSATLTDTTDNTDADWKAAEALTGTIHLSTPALRAEVPSPFPYAENSRVFIVGDVRKTDAAQVAAAFRELFLASQGGALGIFTAIHRLRDCHRRILAPLEAAGLPLYAQHVDPLDPATLVDIFRSDGNACLLGTDAVRDGIDVPGKALRLIVFDRVPWPRPSLLHKARKAAFGGQAWDDMETRFRLKQAFGRLIRKQDDRGVFIMLDAATPSRLLSAFPAGVPVERIGLAETLARTREFLA